MLCAGNTQRVLGDGAAGVERGARHAPENPLRLLSASSFCVCLYFSNLLLLIVFDDS
jgi:hypothetical protein